MWLALDHLSVATVSTGYSKAYRPFSCTAYLRNSWYITCETTCLMLILGLFCAKRNFSSSICFPWMALVRDSTMGTGHLLWLLITFKNVCALDTHQYGYLTPHHCTPMLIFLLFCPRNACQYTQQLCVVSHLLCLRYCVWHTPKHSCTAQSETCQTTYMPTNTSQHTSCLMTQCYMRLMQVFASNTCCTNPTYVLWM